MSADRKRTRGFSLVELVIVIVIIGIIAAIAVPRISRGAKGASDSAVRGDLAALRAAIDLFAAEHKGVYPGKVKNTGTGTGLASDFIDHLTKFSDINGKTGDYDASATPPIIYGPYLRNGIPTLPVGSTSGASGILLDSTNSPPEVAESATEGWVFNPSTGEILANTTATDETGTAYSTY